MALGLDFSGLVGKVTDGNRVVAYLPRGARVGHYEARALRDECKRRGGVIVSAADAASIISVSNTSNQEKSE